jgi:hypothetical protein
MGGGSSEKIVFTESERKKFIQEIKNELVDDNNYITINELTKILNAGCTNTICRRIEKAGFKIKKRYVEGKLHNTLTIDDARIFINGMRY